MDRLDRIFSTANETSVAKQLRTLNSAIKDRIVYLESELQTVRKGIPRDLTYYLQKDKDFEEDNRRS